MVQPDLSLAKLFSDMSVVRGSQHLARGLFRGATAPHMAPSAPKAFATTRMNLTNTAPVVSAFPQLVNVQLFTPAARHFSTTEGMGESFEERQFIEAAFDMFDENGDGVLVWSELEQAYLHKRAGSEMARLFAIHGLADKGLTFKVLPALRFCDSGIWRGSTVDVQYLNKSGETHTCSF